MSGLEITLSFMGALAIVVAAGAIIVVLSKPKPKSERDAAINTAIKAWLADPELNKPKDLICPDTGCHRHARSRLAKVSPVNPCEHSVPHRKKGSCGHIKNCPDCIKFK